MIVVVVVVAGLQDLQAAAVVKWCEVCRQPMTAGYEGTWCVGWVMKVSGRSEWYIAGRKFVTESVGVVMSESKVGKDQVCGGRDNGSCLSLLSSASGGVIRLALAYLALALASHVNVLA